jgi:hypothetical protein
MNQGGGLPPAFDNSSIFTMRGSPTVNGTVTLQSTPRELPTVIETWTPIPGTLTVLRRSVCAISQSFRRLWGRNRNCLFWGKVCGVFGVDSHPLGGAGEGPVSQRSIINKRT